MSERAVANVGQRVAVRALNSLQKFWRVLHGVLTGGARTLSADDDPVFSAAIIALAAKLARADGVVSPHEQAAFRTALQATHDHRVDVDRLFSMAQQTTRGFRGYAQKIAKRYRHNPAVLEDVLDVLFFIARADGHVTDQELSFLHDVAADFGFTDLEFKRIRNCHIGPDAFDPYMILGVDYDVDQADLRRAWRHALMNNHPDMAMARGFAGAVVVMSAQKTAMINAAYRQIRKEKGFV